MSPIDLVTAAHAQGAAPAGPQSALSALVPVLLMFAVFYFLLIRPQQKKSREHQSMLESLARGDEVVTQGGMHGTIVALTDQVVTLEVAGSDDGKGRSGAVRIKFDRSAVARRRQSGGGQES